MTTYFAGVGTVVGALALGFGSGIVLTITAIKETPAGPTRIERVARPEPTAAPPQVVGAKAIPLLAADSAPAVKPVSAIQSQQPVAEVPKETQHKEEQQPKQAELTKQTEQKEAEQRRATERKIDRHKRYAERKAREVATARMKQRQLEEQNQQSPSWHLIGLKNLTSTCSRAEASRRGIVRVT
jgi:type IV secretory pathway VirB10-like protein